MGWPFFTLLSKAPRVVQTIQQQRSLWFHGHLIKSRYSFSFITCYWLLRCCVFVLFSILGLMAVVVVQSTMYLKNVLLVCNLNEKDFFIIYGSTKRQRPCLEFNHRRETICKYTHVSDTWNPGHRVCGYSVTCTDYYMLSLAMYTFPSITDHLSVMWETGDYTCYYDKRQQCMYASRPFDAM